MEHEALIPVLMVVAAILLVLGALQVYLYGLKSLCRLMMNSGLTQSRIYLALMAIVFLLGLGLAKAGSIFGDLAFGIAGYLIMFSAILCATAYQRPSRW